MLEACRKCGAPLLMHRIRFAGWLRGFRIACPQLVSDVSPERYVPATEVTAPVTWPGRALVLRIDAPHLGDDAFYPLVTHALQDAIQHNNATCGGEFPPGGRYLFQGTSREVRVRLFLPDEESAAKSGRILCYGNPEPRSSWVKPRFLHPDDSKNFGRIEIDAEAHDSLTSTMAIIGRQAERAAVRTLERIGYSYHGAQQWKPPLGPKPNWLADRPAAAAPAGMVTVPPERNIDDDQDDYESADPYSLGHCDGWNDCRKALLAAVPAAQATFQQQVETWAGECFPAETVHNLTERGDRVLEETLELLQSLGYDRGRVATLVEYVFGRPVGEPAQEVGGVMVTLALYCEVAGLDMDGAARAELARINTPDVMAKIRTKQAAKNALHFDSPLPGASAAPSAQFKIGDRVTWTSYRGGKFDGTITGCHQHFDAQLDDGCRVNANAAEHFKLIAAAPAAQVAASADRDAYEGAREDLLDWKRRAQRAEAELRRIGYKGVDASEAPASKPLAWRAIETAPRDGKLLRLLVQFDEHATEDSTEPSPTIGCNNEFYDGENVWKFAGWCWSHDHFTSGSGTPIGWLPLLDEEGAGDSPAAQVAVQIDAAGWIVADGQGKRWRFWGDTGPEWTTERDKALRFARRCDAEAFAREDEDAWLIQPICHLVAAPAVVVDELGGNHKLDTDTHVFFYEQDFYVLSNFSSFSIWWDGNYFPTSEAAYHFQKFPANETIQRDIQHAASAHDAFKIAEGNKGLRRADWDEVKLDVMRQILHAKAAQHEYVRRKLLATGDRILVEDSWRDDYWGWGPNRDGQNMLGKLWMEVRAELAREG